MTSRIRYRWRHYRTVRQARRWLKTEQARILALFQEVHGP